MPCSRQRPLVTTKSVRLAPARALQHALQHGYRWNCRRANRLDHRLWNTSSHDESDAEHNALDALEVLDNSGTARNASIVESTSIIAAKSLCPHTPSEGSMKEGGTTRNWPAAA
mmetsp:Transcript_83227/g.230944  ORF Transcript_83227/g.230944 Transcript_83227/m.230944 type:complete len:114 (+) Transcript_83227:421-762(+)